MWITNGSVADVAVVWAKTGRAAVRGFLVPKGTPGFAAEEIKHKMSLRASRTAELAFNEVRLPADAVLPGVRGLRGPLGCLNKARFGIVCGAPARPGPASSPRGLRRQPQAVRPAHRRRSS